MSIPAGIYRLKVTYRNTRTWCEIYSKLTIKTPERRLASFWCFYCYLWTSSTPWSSISMVYFEHVIAGWDILCWWSWFSSSTICKTRTGYSVCLESYISYIKAIDRSNEIQTAVNFDLQNFITKIYTPKA